MSTVQRLYHPLTPAIGVTGVAAMGLTLTLVNGGSAAWLWWLLIGLGSGYAISGSV